MATVAELALIAKDAADATFRGITAGLSVVRGLAAEATQELTGFARGMGLVARGLTAAATASAAAAAGMADLVAKFNPAAVLRFRLAADDLSAAIGRVLLPALDRWTAVVRGVGDLFASLAPETQTLARGLAVAGVAFVAATAATAAFGAAMSTAFGGLPVLVGGVVGGMAGLAFVLRDTAEVQAAVVAAGGAASRVLNAVGVAAQALLPAVGPAVEAMGRLAVAVSGTLARAVLGAAPTVERVGRAVAGLFQSLATAAEPLGRVFERVAEVAGRVLSVRVEAVTWFLSEIAEAAGRAGPQLERLVESFGYLFDSFVEGVGYLLEGLKDLTGESDGLAAVLSVLTTGIDLAAAFFRGAGYALGAVLSAVRSRFDTLRTAVEIAIAPVARIARLFGLIGRADGGTFGPPPGSGPRPDGPDSFRPGASAGLSIRNVQISSVDDYIRRAQVAAFGAGGGGQQDTVPTTLAEINRYLRENLAADIGRQVAANQSNRVAQPTPGTSSGLPRMSASSMAEQAAAWAVRQAMRQVGR